MGISECIKDFYSLTDQYFILQMDQVTTCNVNSAAHSDKPIENHHKTIEC